MHRATRDGGDDVVRELLGADVHDAATRIATQDFMRDGLHEVRFAESGGAVNEERIVGLAGRL